MIQLIPGHGWFDIIGIVGLVFAAFAAYFTGLLAISGRINRNIANTTSNRSH